MPSASASAAGRTPEPSLWEEARECGACGASGWESSGRILGRRLGVCRACGLLRLVDRVTESRLDILYGRSHADPGITADQLERQLTNPTFAHRRRRLEDALDGREPRLFEVGCGDGNFLATLRRAGWRVSGTEYSNERAAVARTRHGLAVTAYDLVRDRPRLTPSPVVAAYHVLEHLYHPAEWLAVVRDLVEPGGLLHLQVPNYASLTRALTGPAWASFLFPSHVYFYTPAHLRQLLAGAGFVGCSVTTWDPWHGPGVAAGSLACAARYALTGQLPWTDVCEDGGTDGRDTAAAAATGAWTDGLPVRGWRRLSQPGLRGVGYGLARAGAALGRGEVVDIIATRAD